MPYYDYKCTECDNEFEKNLKISDRETPIQTPC